MSSVQPTPERPPLDLNKYTGSKPIPQELDALLVDLSRALIREDTQAYQKVNRTIVQKYRFNLVVGIANYKTHGQATFIGLKKGRDGLISDIAVIREKASKCLGALSEEDPAYYETISPKAIKTAVTAVKQMVNNSTIVAFLRSLIHALKSGLNRLIPFSSSLTIQGKIAALKAPQILNAATRSTLSLREQEDILIRTKKLTEKYKKQLDSVKKLPAKERRQALQKLNSEVSQTLYLHMQNHIDLIIEALNVMINKTVLLKPKQQALETFVKSELMPLRESLQKALEEEPSLDTKKVGLQTRGLFRLLRQSASAIVKLEKKLAPFVK